MRIPTIRRRGDPVDRGWLWRCLTALLVVPGVSVAAEWKVTPTLNLMETYSDNIGLAPRGRETDEFITQINPGISLQGTGRRLTLNLNYTMQNLFYLKNDQRNRINHQLNSNATATLIEDKLFVDGGVSIRQQPTSLTGPISFDNLSLINNRTNVTTYRISPYLRHAFDSFAVSEVRYGYNKVDFGTRGFDSESNQYSARLSSGPSFNRVPWGLSYNQTIINYDASRIPDTKFEVVTGQLSYILSRKFSVFANGGYEDNDYAFAAGRQRPSGPFWNAGATWSPTTRTSLRASYGKRFFGNNYSLNLTHKTRNSSWQLSYVEDTVTMRQLLFEQRFGLVFIDPITSRPTTDTRTAIPFVFEFNAPFLTNDVFIRKRWQGSAGYRLKRNDLNLTLFKEHREFQTRPETQDIWGGQATWGLQFGPYTKLAVGSGLQRLDLPFQGRKDDLWNLTASVSRNLQPNLTGAIEYRYLMRDSNVSSAEYRENRITARIGMTF